ncbi:hypothetical protein COV16_00690 [Candidatus Woesearchaeota archaeon CG10_big_fil_rev_8_21_14_0_10_34_8]|nr:MAG: hypothetical protein COV16_00690 [Candidatus Woesearchaeota archaeon CG10_big_fil_rev_8_21_14_0_10_34_8]
MVNKTVLTVIVSIILTILIVSLVNVGLSIFLESPQYESFCGEYRMVPEKIQNATITCSVDTKTCDDGTILSRNPEMGCEFPPCSSDFKTCQDEYDSFMRSYNQIRYYVFAGIGFVLLLIGLFSGFSMLQLTGLISGGILLLEGIILNFQNKIIVFVSLLLIFLIFGLSAWRIVNKKQDDLPASKKSKR